MKKDYYLYIGRNEKQFFALPQAWFVSHFVEDEQEAPVPSIGEMTLDAITQPLGTAPFRDLVGGANRIAVVVDDATRPTPVAEVLDALLAYIADAGFPRENVTVVVALGTHEVMSADALARRVGEHVLSRYKVVQHNAWGDDLVPVHVPNHERSVKINREVAGADLKVAISSILPHPMAGYGGGPKSMMPGICDYEFIRDHHMKHLINPRSVAGATKGNPFHENCMLVARTIGLNFSINCLYNPKGQVIRIVAGSLDAAFAEAVQFCLKKLGYRFEEKVDVTITSSYPHTHGHQLFKGLSAPDAVTKETGAILLLAPIVAPINAEFIRSFEVIKERSCNNSAAYIREHLLKGKAYLPDKSIDFNMAMSTPFLRPQIRVILVSPHVSRQQAEIMGMEYADSIEQGLERLKTAYPQAKVAIFPSGGLIIPIVTWQQ
ncbi:MAG TPA: lactate racemase domain-containing protein [Syntrophorhabdaceae bacterium]|nr:lactate racemase domain-containing protein [Syntrophorhabdaceae bacterium]